MKYWGKGQGGLYSWVYFVVICLVDKGFVICSVFSSPDDSTM